ncbi:hypothetical protein BaRGS_00006458 [Batillaria attramentaria]|uniref:Uncharacterized protein n=1 Tax=Batillaria attramentaria TaxID=370345 RepID=A0ABD0LSE7_9CAEN
MTTHSGLLVGLSSEEAADDGVQRRKLSSTSSTHRVSLGDEFLKELEAQADTHQTAAAPPPLPPRRRSGGGTTTSQSRPSSKS